MTSQEEFVKILTELEDLRDSKNADYGDGFFETYDEYGILGLEFDIGRKFVRIKQFRKTSILEVKEETFEDTLKDIAVLAVNGIMWWRRFNEHK
jgi:hypothetical protein